MKNDDKSDANGDWEQHIDVSKLEVEDNGHGILTVLMTGDNMKQIQDCEKFSMSFKQYLLAKLNYGELTLPKPV